LNVTILGDIQHSRVARSNIQLLGKFGCRFTLCGPAMWLPREIERVGPAGCEIRRTSRMNEALTDADVIIVLRVQSERMNEPSLPTDEYVMQFQLNEERLALARPGALVLHPGPMIRGLEIDSAVADGPQSCVLEQVTNGVAVRMALLYLLTGGEPSVESKKESPSAGD
jgi:aspartate carbamoyltransferase catalytic subunit